MYLNKRNITKIFLIHGLLGVLLISFFLPKIPGIWESLDLAAFHFFKQPWLTTQPLLTFWALANHRLADLVEDICILAFYLVAVFRSPKQLRLQRSCEFIFCVLLTACTILFINRLLCRDLLALRRKSPSLVLDYAVPYWDELSWLSVKKRSSKSFPGDHATTALMFACSYAWFVRGRLAVLALLYAGFLCLPRLAVGAHWFSDIVVGSCSIVLFALTWAFFTPLADRSVGHLKKLFLKWKFKKTSPCG